MLAVGYARVSTEKQAEFGVSLDAQVEKIKAMAVVHSAELRALLVDEGESGKHLNRPGMAQVLELVEAGKVEAVIVAKLDRLTRSVKDLAVLLDRLERRRVALISVAESLDTRSASGRLVITIMTAVSQWEREVIGERTRDALRHKIANHERAGTVPYGYRLSADGTHVEPELNEQAMIQEIRALRNSGKLLRKIAAELNYRGLRTRRAVRYGNTTTSRAFCKSLSCSDADARSRDTPTV